MRKNEYENLLKVCTTNNIEVQQEEEGRKEDKRLELSFNGSSLSVTLTLQDSRYKKTLFTMLGLGLYTQALT